MKTKLKSVIHATRHSFGGAVCAVTVILISFTAQAQNLFEADQLSGYIYEFTTNGTQSTFASGLSGPTGLAFSSAGNLFELDSGSGNIFEFTNNGVTLSSNYVTFASGLNNPQGLAFDNSGNLFVANTGGHNILEYTNNAGTLTTNAVIFASGLIGPLGLAFNSAGNLFVADAGTETYNSAHIYEYTPLGAQSTVASVPTQPFGPAFDSAGDLFVADVGANGPGEGDIYEFTNNGVTLSSNYVVFAYGLDYADGLAFDSAGNLFEADGGSGNIFEFTNGVAAEKGTFVSGLNHPSGLVFSAIVTNSTPPVPFTYTTNNGAIIITAYTGTNLVVTIPGTINGLPVTGIGAEVFFLNNNITSVTIPQSITSIGNDEFSGCSGLTSITIPNSVTSIGFGAFGSCISLTSITIPSSVTSIGSDAFAGCTSLTAFIVDSNNPAYSSVAGVFFDKSQSTLIEYPIGNAAQTYTIPNSVTSIGSGAFEFCSSLTNITIPNSVTNIKSEAFDSCTSLTSMTIPNSVISIGVGSFLFCFSLTNVTIPSSVISIGTEAFDSCSSLVSVGFQGNAPTPANDTSVFQNDTGAPIAYYLQGATGWGATFDGIPTSVILPPAPALGISTYGSQPAVFFPTATGINYVLQMTTNLANGPWVTVSNGIPISGVIITNPPAAAFFQLANP